MMGVVLKGEQIQERRTKNLAHNEWYSFRSRQHYLVAVGDSVEKLAIQPACFMLRRMVNSVVGKGTESLRNILDE